jgi:hypothetical protein
VIDRLDISNADDAERMRVMMLSDDVSDGDSIGNGTGSDEDYAEPREGNSESAEDASSDDDCCNEVDATDSCFIGQDKTKWGKVKSTTHIRHRWQNILTKLPGVTGQGRKATTHFEACIFV